MDKETPDTLEVAWLGSDTDSEEYVQVGLRWFDWVKRIIKLLADSVSLITINRNLDGALEKLIVMNNGQETDKKATMDSVIRIQKMIEEAQYRFTKLSAALNDSSQQSIIGSKSRGNPAESWGNSDEEITFDAFLKTLVQKTLPELREVGAGVGEALNSISDALVEKDPGREDKSDKSLLARPIQTLLVGVTSCGVASVLVSIFQNHMGFSVKKSEVSVLVGITSIAIWLKMRGNQAVKTEKRNEKKDSADTSLEDATFAAALTFSLLNKQLESILQVPIDENEKFYQSAVGHSLVECLEKIEVVSRQYLDLSETNYGSLSDRHLHRNSSSKRFTRV